MRSIWNSYSIAAGSVVFFSCAVLQDHTYYAPKDVDTERTIVSERFPDSVEGPPDVAIWLHHDFSLKAWFDQRTFVVGAGPAKPFPLPVLPVWLLIWNGPGTLDPPRLFIDLTAKETDVKIDFSQFRLFVPVHGGSEPPESIQEVRREDEFSGWQDCGPTVTVPAGTSREFVLTYPAAGRVSEIELEISGVSTTTGQVSPGEIKFERANDAVLY